MLNATAVCESEGKRNNRPAGIADRSILEGLIVGFDKLYSSSGWFSTNDYVLRVYVCMYVSLYTAEPNERSKMLQRLANGENNYTTGNLWG